jgi:serine/threonine protein phosphatase PrpC
VVWGSTLYVANAGDSRAVLSRHGKAIELTRDHKPHEPSEKQRIELCGGYVCSEGRLCGELAVARAIGDFHLPQLKGGSCSSAGELSLLAGNGGCLQETASAAAAYLLVMHNASNCSLVACMRFLHALWLLPACTCA